MKNLPLEEKLFEKSKIRSYFSAYLILPHPLYHFQMQKIPLRQHALSHVADIFYCRWFLECASNKKTYYLFDFACKHLASETAINEHINKGTPRWMSAPYMQKLRWVDPIFYVGSDHGELSTKQPHFPLSHNACCRFHQVHRTIWIDHRRTTFICTLNWHFLRWVNSITLPSRADH